MQALFQASAQNQANLKDEQAAIAADRQKMLQSQLAQSAAMGEGYEEERRLADRELKRVKTGVEETNRRFNEMMNQGIDPYGTKTAGVSGMSAGILAAAAALRGEDPQKTFDFYDNLIDKDIQQQKGMLKLYGDKLDNQLLELERVTGDAESAEELYRANRMEQMAQQAKILSDQTENAEVKASLNESSLGYMRKAEELKYQGQVAAQKAALARMRATGGSGRGRTAKPKTNWKRSDAEKAAEAQIGYNNARLVDDAYQGLLDKGYIGFGEKLVRSLPFGDDAANAYSNVAQSLWDDQESIDKIDFQRLADQQFLSAATSVYGALGESDRAYVLSQVPSIGDSPQIWKSALNRVLNDSELRLRAQASRDEERAAELKADPEIKRPHYGRAIGR